MLPILCANLLWKLFPLAMVDDTTNKQDMVPSLCALVSKSVRKYLISLVESRNSLGKLKQKLLRLHIFFRRVDLGVRPENNPPIQQFLQMGLRKSRLCK